MVLSDVAVYDQASKYSGPVQCQMELTELQAVVVMD